MAKHPSKVVTHAARPGLRGSRKPAATKAAGPTDRGLLRLGRAIRHMREDRGWSQAELVRRIMLAEGQDAGPRQDGHEQYAGVARRDGLPDHHAEPDRLCVGLRVPHGNRLAGGRVRAGRAGHAGPQCRRAGFTDRLSSGESHDAPADSPAGAGIVAATGAWTNGGTASASAASVPSSVAARTRCAFAASDRFRSASSLIRFLLLRPRLADLSDLESGWRRSQEPFENLPPQSDVNPNEHVASNGRNI